MNHFRLLPFIGGLVAGYFFFIVYKNVKRNIIMYPHPENVHGRVYKDNNGVCYSYTAQDVNCDQNEKNLKPYPVQ
jgi:hypothetical protein